MRPPGRIVMIGAGPCGPGAAYSRGRFGAWRYVISNQHPTLMQGAEVAARLMLGAAEPRISS